jgi:hypothetical protein
VIQSLQRKIKYKDDVIEKQLTLVTEKELDLSAAKRASTREVKAVKAAARSEASDLTQGYHEMTMELSECWAALSQRKLQDLTRLSDQRLRAMRTTVTSANNLRSQLDDMKTRLDNVFAYVEEMHQGEDDLLKRYCF